MRYVALLRGVNVGGKNKLPMPELVAAVSKLGHSDVSSYINSGNILFSSRPQDALALQSQLRGLILDRFGIDTPVAVFNAGELISALAAAPDWWNRGGDSKHNAIFVIPPASPEQVAALVGEGKPEYESVAYRGNVIFWSAPIKTFSHTRWSKVVATAAYGSITIRNANTALKLAALLAD